MPNFTPFGATCHPCGAKKPQNWPLSKLNNRRFVLCAMLPVNEKSKHSSWTADNAVWCHAQVDFTGAAAMCRGMCLSR